MSTIEVSGQRDCLVFYHAPPCNDGWTAALISWMVLGDSAEYLPVHYQSKLQDPLGKKVLMFDFSLKREAMEAFAERADTIDVYDHHRTAENELAGLSYCTFDMDKCGARMALEYWQAQLLGTENEGSLDFMTELVAYVEDRDLWRWHLPYSKEVNAVLASLPKDFRAWQDIAWQVRQVVHYAEHREAVAAGLARSHIEKPAMIIGGEALLRQQETDVDMLCRKAQVMQFHGQTVAVVNAPMLQSEVAGHLATAPGIAFGMAWWQGGSDGLFHYSLRSRSNDGVEGMTRQVDVSSIAEQYSGGGHAAASGFSDSHPPWELQDGPNNPPADMEPFLVYLDRVLPGGG